MVTVNKLKQTTIAVKNAEGCPDTTATILVQNKIKTDPKVSVIIPVYNAEKYLAQCLDSLTNQTLQNIEIICVNDGSTDGSLGILKEYAARDNRITILTQDNLHAGVARNAGIAVARGKYLSFLDSDDFFELDMLEQMYQHADKLKLDVCICDANVHDETNHNYWSQHNLQIDLIPKDKEVFNKNDLQKNIYKFINPAAWTKLFNRDFVIKNSLYFQNLYSCNDIGMSWLALSFAERISVINKVFVHYRYASKTQISSKRGGAAINIIHAYCFIKQRLIQNNMDYLLKYLDERTKGNILWELSCCNTKEKKQLKKQAENIMKKEFKNFESCFKHESFIVHFIKHMRDVIKPRLKTAWEYPIRVHDKYHRLKDKIRQIKNGK